MVLANEGGYLIMHKSQINRQSFGLWLVSFSKLVGVEHSGQVFLENGKNIIIQNTNYSLGKRTLNNEK